MKFHTIEMILILLSLSIGVTALAKKANKPYTIALVIVGAIIGLLPVSGFFEDLKEFFATDYIFRTAIIGVFLPALLGEASLKLPIRDVKNNAGHIATLALAGTLITFLITGGLTHLALGLPLQTALVFGALMAATDPVSVISVFKTLGVDRRLSVIIEGESLINDGVAVVIFSLSAFSLASISGYGPWGAAVGFAIFIKVMFGGALLGMSLGFLVSRIVSLFDDYPLENALSVVLFYGSYIIAEYFGVSGVIAVVASGLVLGSYGAEIGMTPTTRLSITVFWDTVVLVANSMVFILVGLEISRIRMAEHIIQILIAVGLVLLGRSVAILLSTAGLKLPWSWKHVLNWGGLKGSLSLALALSLPPDFSGREMLIALTFGVVFFSLVGQGLTIGTLIGFLGLQKSVQGLKEYECLTFDLQQALAAKEELERLNNGGRVSPSVYEMLDREISRRISVTNRQFTDLYRRYPGLLQKQEFTARKKLLYAEHQAIEKLLGEGFLSEELGSERKRTVQQDLEAVREKGIKKPDPT